MEIPDNVENIIANLLSHSYDAYIVGGAVRDHLLGIEPSDYDIFTNCLDLKSVFPDAIVLGGVERQEKILTVIVDGVEVSSYRANGDRTEIGDDLKTHCSTCDFTINSICCDFNGSIIDYSNGKKDLHAGKLKAVGNPEDRIKEDPLRIFRGIRFACKYDLDIESKTRRAFMQHNNLINTLPKERITTELFKLLEYKESLQMLRNYGLLQIIFPEFEKVICMAGGEHHNEYVDSHMMMAFQIAHTLTDNVKLKLAAFLHDIGKGETQTFDKGDKQTHFYEHEKVGANLMEARLLSLKFSNEDIKYITTLIRLHMWIHDTKNISDKAYVKLFNKLDGANIPVEDFVLLNYCDNQANGKNEPVSFLEFLKCHRVIKKYYELKYKETPFTVKDLKIGGKDVIERLRLKPGKLIGEILDMLYNKVLDGDIKNNRAELLNELKSKSKLADNVAYNIDRKILNKLGYNK